ncbi:MAG: MBL fold metallo-hydrolase [Clostridiales bacterium]|nr:MBL fold metallo-hydrolase [Clostridiales bacterium]
MKLTFLGTSHGVPEKHRKCTSVLLTVQGKHYIFDAGVPLYTAVKQAGLDLHDIQAIFLTHMHGDHATGLIEFVDLATWYDKTLRPEIYLAEIAGFEGMAAWLQVTHGEDKRGEMPPMKEVSEGAFYDDGRVRITAINNEHLPNRPSYSFVIDAEGKRLVLTGDMGHDHYSDFPRPAYESECDLVVTEAAHCRLTDCMDVFGKLSTKKLIVSHIVPWNEPEAEKLKEMVSYPVETAFDGMSVEI